MTKNRARKRAAHERATLTGESYVVARRNLDEPITAVRSMSPVTRVLHDLTHRVPGVPEHHAPVVRTPRTKQAAEPRRIHRNSGQVYREPKVLVEWQNWIARRVGALPPRD